jgi:hypothetical protein
MLALGRLKQGSNLLAIQTLPKVRYPDCLDTQLQAALTNQNNGGAEEDRTPDPLLAKQVLSQLSYSPIPLPHCFEAEWWAWVDSNYRPHPYQGCALTN